MPESSALKTRVVSPRGAYPTTRAFRVSSQPIASTTFQHVNPLTPLMHIDNGGAFADNLMTVKVPVHVPAGQFAMAFFYDAQKRRREGIPTVAMDRGRAAMMEIVQHGD